MEIRVKNSVIELVLVRLLESTDKSSGNYVVDYTQFDNEGKPLHTGIIARTDDGKPFNSIPEIIMLFRSILQNSERRQEELVEKYLIGFEEKYEARAEKMKKFISAVDEFLKQLEDYYIEHGEPVHLRYENN